MADAGRGAAVTAPATSANLGPGFDAFGLALELRDRVEAAVIDAGLVIEVSGEGEEAVPRDESHLVVQAMRRTFDQLGVDQPGLHLVCENTIPHGRGLGSSSAAIVAGILLADELVYRRRVPSAVEFTFSTDGDRQRLDSDRVYALATEMEGHPDNVAACLAGGFTIAWETDGGPNLLRQDVDARIDPVVFIPPQPLSTDVARGLLPDQVSHRDASVNAGRAALMALGLTAEPGLLHLASDDRLHQESRRLAMPTSLALVDVLRSAGIAAMLSGAGPAVLVLDTTGGHHDFDALAPEGWRVVPLKVAATGATIVG